MMKIIKPFHPLAQCPFCHNIPELHEFPGWADDNDWFHYNVECSCGKLTKMCDSADEAITEWNNGNIE